MSAGRAVDGRDRFSAASRAARRVSLRRWGVLGGVVGVVALLVWALGWSSLTAASAVTVTGVRGAEARAIKAELTGLLGQPLLRIDTDTVQERVRSRITVADASVSREWPSTLVVSVTPRTAALVVKDSRGRLQLVDRSGVAFGTVKTAPQGVPVVTARGSEQATTPAALRAALDLVAALPAEMYSTVDAVTVTSANLVTFTMGSTTVIWGSGEQGSRKAAVLRVLLRTKPTPSAIDVSAPDTPVTR